MAAEFRRPRWIVAGLAVIGFAVLCFTVLAPWQLGKNARVEDRIDKVSRGSSLAPVPLSQLQPAGAGFDAANEWRQVTLTGSYVGDGITVRRRSAGGRTEIVVPFRLADGRVVLVDRGIVDRAQVDRAKVDRATVDRDEAPTATPIGEQTIIGRLRSPEATGRYGAPRESNGKLVGYALDPAQLGGALDVSAEPYYLQLAADQAGALGEIPLPPPDRGPYYSYGLQWIAFGVLTPVVVVYFSITQLRRRRAEAAATSRDGEPPHPGNGTLGSG